MKGTRMTPQTWHETKTRIRYKETDRMGVVYYGNYLTFFEIGRAECMRHLGLPYSELERLGFRLVVTEAAAKYHANVGYDALITIRTAVTELKRVQLRFDYRIFDENENLLVSGHTGHACLDEALKLTKFPDSLKETIEAHFPELKK
jgi:acyl-CoA thioester hydrolase